MNVYLADIAGLGFTPWRNLMPSLMEIGMLTNPHGWDSLIKTHYLAHLSAGRGNICTIEGATITTEDVELGNYPIKDWKIVVSEDPGFGKKLLKMQEVKSHAATPLLVLNSQSSTRKMAGTSGISVPSGTGP